MKRRPYDYSGFSLHRLNEPRFAHAKLLAGWIGYFAMYFITENLIPVERCHEIHCALDDMIPFHEGFVIFYVGWYLYVVAALAYPFFYNVEGFKKLQVFIMITQAVAMLCYIVYPSIQYLRPEQFPRENFFTWVLGIIYAFDTPTGVFPSLHVAYSAGIVSVSLKDKELPFGWKAFVVFFAVMVCFAVSFVKQHSALDVIAALPVCLLAEALVYGKDYWLPRFRRKTA